MGSHWGSETLMIDVLVLGGTWKSLESGQNYIDLAHFPDRSSLRTNPLQQYVRRKAQEVTGMRTREETRIWALT